MPPSGSRQPVEKRIHWRRTATPPQHFPALNGHVEADFVVVGGGLTGTRTALGLAESGATVVLLEADTIGWGASGRSGGQCNPIWRATPDELCERLGDACAGRLVEATISAADALFADIGKYGVDCDGEQNGWVQAAHCPPAHERLERLGTAWRAAGAKIDFLDRDATRRKSGSGEYDYALFHHTGGHVHPLSLTRGFARTATRFGARLFENSPVRSLSKGAGRWRVATPTGTVSAERVILTTNAYTDDLWPKLKQTFVPMVSVSLATAPVPEDLQGEVLPGSVTLADSRRAIYYCRYDRDRRLVFGCVGSAEDPETLGGVSRLRRGLATVFPQLEGIGLEAAWAGRIAVTPEMMPHLHEPESGVLAALGFSGRGIAMTSVMARAVVKKALGAADDALPFPVSPIRPVPLHWAARRGVPLMAPAIEARDRLDKMFGPR